jgi:hypothetical protein
MQMDDGGGREICDESINCLAPVLLPVVGDTAAAVSPTLPSLSTTKSTLRPVRYEARPLHVT